jgi:lipopolysaccharide transport system permease protein
MALVRNDLRNRYRRSMIGIGWSLLQPIAMTAILCVVFSRMFGNDLQEAAPRMLSGLTFWGFITAVILQGCQCFFSGESYIRQYPAPLAIYPLRTVLGAGFHFLLAMAIVVIYMCGIKGYGNWSAFHDGWVHGLGQWAMNLWHSLPALLSIIPTLLLLFVIGWSLAVLAGISNVMFQDSVHLFEVGLQIVFYATPIILPAHLLREKGLGLLIDWNPFASLLELIQNPILHGRMPSTWAVSISSLIGVVSASLAMWALSRFQKRLIFYL